MDLFGGGMEKSAIISPCGQYRYRLERAWDRSFPAAVFVCLNPSIADATLDDPTLRKCVGFARRWGCGHLVLVNLFALRATDPADMKRHPSPVGPDNDRHIREAVTIPGATVCLAWGTHGGHMRRGAQVREALASLGIAHRTLGLTRCGNPRHPLMQPYPKDAA